MTQLSNYPRPKWIFKRLNNIIKVYSWNIFEKELNDNIIVDDLNNVEILRITKVNQITELESDELLEAGFGFLRDKELIVNGCTLFYTFIEGILAHVTHVFVGPNAHKLHPLNFAMEPEKKIVGLAAFTHPFYRRKGLHLYTRSKVFNFLQEEGYNHVWDVQNRDNVPVKKSVLKIGYYLWGAGYRINLLTFIFVDIVFKKSSFLPLIKIYFKIK
jgi:hypothetical protein